jgi:hypothetical protein
VAAGVVSDPNAGKLDDLKLPPEHRIAEVDQTVAGALACDWPYG